MAQAKFAVRPFKNSTKQNQPKLQNQTAQSVPMQRTQVQETKEQRSLVPVMAEVSDSEDDVPILTHEPKRLAVKILPFSNSPVTRNALVVTQCKGNTRKQRYDPISNQKQRKAAADLHDKVRSDFASHQCAVYGDM